MMLTLIVMAVPAAMYAQKPDVHRTTLNGLDLSKEYTKEELFAAFGVPDEEDAVIHSYFVYHRNTNLSAEAGKQGVPSSQPGAYPVMDDIGYDYNSETGKYTKTVFTIHSDQIVFNDCVRVGDPVSKVYEMWGKTKEVSINGKNRIYWIPCGDPDDPYTEWDLEPYFLYDENGIITRIEKYYD